MLCYYVQSYIMFGVGNYVSFRLWDLTAQRKMRCGRCAENQMFLCFHLFCYIRLFLFLFLFQRLEATSCSYLQGSILSILSNISTLKDENHYVVSKQNTKRSSAMSQKNRCPTHTRFDYLKTGKYLIVNDVLLSSKT
jgi:hypothetical protein